MNGILALWESSKQYANLVTRFASILVMILHLFRRPLWTYSPDHYKWNNLHLYPGYGISVLPIEATYSIDILLLFVIILYSYPLVENVEKEPLARKKLPANTERASMVVEENDETYDYIKNRRFYIRYLTVPCCVLKLLESFTQILLHASIDQPIFTLSPVEAIIFISSEPMFHSSLYRTMWRSLSYFAGLVFMLCCVLVSWSVLGLALMNNMYVGIDPIFVSLQNAIWEMLTVLNTANWPNPIIPSSENMSRTFFLYFLGFSIVVDWGFLNLILGLIVAFFEDSWKNDDNWEDKDVEEEEDKKITAAEKSAKAASILDDDDKEHDRVSYSTYDSSGSTMTEGWSTKNPISSGGDQTALEMVTKADGTPLSKGEQIQLSTDSARHMTAAHGIGGFTDNNDKDGGLRGIKTNNIGISDLEAFRLWLGRIVHDRYFDIVTDLILFGIGLAYVFSDQPRAILNTQVVLNMIELLLRLYVRNQSFLQWITVYRNWSNFLLISVLLLVSVYYFNMCSPNGPPELYHSDSCDDSNLNQTMTPDLDRRIILAVIAIRTCLMWRILLVLRNFSWDLIPKHYQKEIVRAVNIIQETWVSFFHLIVMLVIVMYIFASLGNNIFGGLLSKNPDLPNYDALMASEYAENGYWPLNFNDMFSSFVTIFTLLYVNNMQIVTSGCSATSSKWAQLFFGIFYIIGVLYLKNIFTSFLWNRIGKVLDPSECPVPPNEDEIKDDGLPDKINNKEDKIPGGKDTRSAIENFRTFFDRLFDRHESEEMTTERRKKRAENLLKSRENFDPIESVGVLLVFARHGDKHTLFTTREALEWFRFRNTIQYPLLACCWVLTLLRVFQKPPWLIEGVHKYAVNQYPMFMEQFMTIEVAAALKIPILLFIMVGLVSEILYKLDGARRLNEISISVLMRYGVLAVTFSSLISIMIAAAGNTGARLADWYLSFFSVFYTLWFDRQALKRFIIVVGVVPKLFTLLCVFAMFVMICGGFLMFVFNLQHMDADDDDYNREIYGNYGQSVWNTFTAISSSSYPSQFMPAYRDYREFGIYFMITIVVGGFIILESSLAVVNTAYQNAVTALEEQTDDAKNKLMKDSFDVLCFEGGVQVLERASVDVSIKVQVSEEDVVLASEKVPPEQEAQNSENKKNFSKSKKARKSQIRLQDTGFFDASDGGILKSKYSIDHISGKILNDLIFDLFTNYSSFSKTGKINFNKNCILRNICDVDHDGKISSKDFMTFLTVCRVKLSPVKVCSIEERRDRKLARLAYLKGEGTPYQIYMAEFTQWRAHTVSMIRKWIREHKWLRHLEKRHYEVVSDSIIGILSIFASLTVSIDDEKGSLRASAHTGIVICMMIYVIIELLVKLFLVGWSTFWKDSRYVIDFTTTSAFVLVMIISFAYDGQSHSNTATALITDKRIYAVDLAVEIVQMLRLILYPRNIACFASPVKGVAWDTVISTIASLTFAYAEGFISFSFTFTQLGVLCFGGLIPNAGVDPVLDNSPYGKNNFYILNFNDMPSAFTTLFCCLRISDFDVVTNGMVMVSSVWSRLYFVLYYILGVLLFLNILQSYFVVVFRPKSDDNDNSDVKDELDGSGSNSDSDSDDDDEEEKDVLYDHEYVESVRAILKADISALPELEEINQKGFVIDVAHLVKLPEFINNKEAKSEDLDHVLGRQSDAGRQSDDDEETRKRHETEMAAEIASKYNHDEPLMYLCRLPYKSGMDEKIRFKILNRINLLSEATYHEGRKHMKLATPTKEELERASGRRRGLSTDE
jgi:hypothetical protein